MRATVILVFFILVLPAAGQEHRFWDSKNVILFSVNATIQGMDYWSTERGLRRGAVVESNQFGQTRGARIALKSIGIGAPVGISYALHRKGLHRLERFAPIIFAVPSGIAAGLNLRF